MIKKTGCILSCIIILTFFHASLLFASGLEYPVAAYKGSELEKVRQWEKGWAGKKITSVNVDEVKDFLPESFYNLMKDVDRWGESWFEIVEYQTVPQSPGRIKFTKQYYGKTNLSPEGEILNWVAGYPFPDTKDALEMAHNFRCRVAGDGISTNEKGFIVDGRLKYDMSIEIRNNYLYFAGRNDTPPTPEFEDNPKEIWRAFTMHQLAPPETRNLRIMEIHYKDRTKVYDSWFWMPSIRRIRRRSTSERQDAQGGADFCGYDNFGWDGPIHANTYKYLGQNEYLMARHQDSSKLEHASGECIWNGTQRERIKVHVIEAVSKDPNFLYSRMIWYLDPETWQMLYSDRYDRRGNLWKVMDQHAYVDKGYNDVPIDFFSSNQMIDVQRTHSTIALAEYKFGVEFDQNMFTLQYLQRHGY